MTLTRRAYGGIQPRPIVAFRGTWALTVASELRMGLLDG